MIGDGQRYICKAPRCSAERRESNHWFLIWGENGHLGVQFRSAKFNEDLIKDLTDIGRSVAWVCGSGCAQKVYELFLSGVKFVP